MDQHSSKMINEIYYLNKNNKTFSNDGFGIFIFLILSFTILFLYVKMDIDSNTKNWETNKCNPKYLFFSGYFKKNNGMTAEQTTNYNIIECSSKFGSTISSALGKDFEDTLEKIDASLITFDKRIEEDTKILDEAKRDISGEYNKIYSDISSNMDMRKSIIYKLLLNIGVYMDHLNGIIDYTKKYSENYLNYLMIGHLYKAKTDQTPENRELSQQKMFKIKYILDKFFDRSLLSSNYNI